MRYVPATGPDGNPLKVVNPVTGQQIIEAVDIASQSADIRIALLRLVLFGDLVEYTDPPPRKTMKGE